MFFLLENVPNCLLITESHVFHSGRQVRVLRGFWADHLMSAASGSARGSFSSAGAIAQIQYDPINYNCPFRDLSSWYNNRNFCFISYFLSYRRGEAGKDRTKRKTSNKLSEVIRKSINKASILRHSIQFFFSNLPFTAVIFIKFLLFLQAESISHKKLRDKDGKKKSKQNTSDCGPGDYNNLRLLFKLRERPPDAHEVSSLVSANLNVVMLGF